MKKIFLVLCGVLVLGAGIFLGASHSLAHNSSPQLLALNVGGILESIGSTLRLFKSPITPRIAAPETQSPRPSLTLEALEDGTLDVVISNAKVDSIYEEPLVFEISVFGVHTYVAPQDTTRLVNRWWGRIEKEDIHIGDTINVWGIYNPEKPDLVIAKTLRITEPSATKEGGRNTACEEKAVSAQHPAMGTCLTYESTCAIPRGWIQVPSCEHE